MFRNLFYLILISFIIFVSCHKNFNYQGSIVYHQGPAQGSLLDLNGNCQNFLINGSFSPDSSLNNTNNIEVSVNITQPGNAIIYTDTINGCWFSFRGIISTTGLQKIILRGFGKPKMISFGNFTVHFGSSTCSLNIPNQQAQFTFNAPPDSCANIIVHGSYYVGARLNKSDYIVVSVLVSRPGSYFIQTISSGGMVFSKSGIFPGTGVYNLILMGSGIPLNLGNNQISLQIAYKTCKFSLPLKADTSLYWKFTVEGVQYSGLLDSAYGSLPDTGITILNNPTRIYAAQAYGGNYLNNQDSNSFIIVLSRLNQPLSVGNYHSLSYLGAGDFNGYMSYQNNISPFLGFEAYTSTTYKNSFDFTTVVTQVDYSTGLIEGTFSGPVFKLLRPDDNSPKTVYITEGYFKTYLAH